MSTINPGVGRVLAGLGGVLLIASLLMNWADDRTGWELLPVWDVFILLTGVCGVVAALTGGRFGFFRPDLSFNAMTDIFAVMLWVLIPWMIWVDFPDGADRGAGVWVALAGAVVQAAGAGDFAIKSLFPRSAQSETRPAESGP